MTEVATNQQQVVRLWVQRCIYDNTTGSDSVQTDEVALFSLFFLLCFRSRLSSADSLLSRLTLLSVQANRLVKYLAEESTRDLCFREIANRAMDDKTKDPRVLSKVVALLKKYLVRYPPNYETLLYLDHFPSVVAAEGAAQSLAFVRALVQQLLRRGITLQEAMSRENQSQKRNGGRRGLSGLSYDEPLPLLSNFWVLCRVGGDAVPELNAGGHQAFFEAILGEGNDDLHSASAGRDVLGINVFAVPTCDRIAIVAEFKMQSGLKATSNYEQMQKKRAVPKSQPYSKQEPLVLEPREFRKLVGVVMKEDAIGRERHLMASKVLLKALMDAYIVQSPAQAARQTLQVMLRMVSRDDSRVRLHALNLLLNLCMHAQLVVPTAVFSAVQQQPAKQGRIGTTRATSVTASEDDSGAEERRARVAEVLNSLWVVTCETLLRLSHVQEDSGVAWGAALSLILLQATEQGNANFRKLLALDKRVLTSILLHVGSLGDDAQRLATTLLGNCLLEISPDRRSCLLPPDRLTQANLPVYQIVDLYVGARSAETTANTFAMLFQHIMGKLRDAAPPNSLSRFNEQVGQLNAVLTGVEGGPEVFRKVFLHPLSTEEVRSMSGLITAVRSQAKNQKGITVRHAAKRQNTKLLAGLDSQFVSDFFTALFKEGSDYLGLDPELEAYKERMLTHPKSLRPLLNTLDELLFSPWPLDRHHGRNWLFDLMVVVADLPVPAQGEGRGGPKKVGIAAGRGSGGRGSGGRGKPLSPRPPTKGVGPEARAALRSPRASADPGNANRTLTAAAGAAGGSSTRANTIGHSASRRVAAQMAVEGSAAAGTSLSSDSSPPELKIPPAQMAPATEVLPKLSPRAQTPRLRLPGATPEEQEDAFRKMKVLVAEAHEKLLTSPSADVRRGYLLVLRRLLSYVRSRLPPLVAIVHSVTLLDTHCANLVRRKESDPEILMQMWDLLFDFVASPPPLSVVRFAADEVSATSTSAGIKAKNSAARGGSFQRGVDFDAAPCKDTNYMQFLNGSRKVSMDLLCRLDVKAFKLLFDRLPPAYENVRVAVLIFIAAMCNDKRDEKRAKATFTQVGQLNWFKSMLDDPNPQVSYHASRFLSEYLQAQDPVQYQVALKKLINVLPPDKIAIDFFHVLALLGDSAYLTVGKSK